MDFSILVNSDTAKTPNSCIALLGGGGKTGLQQRLGRDLASKHDRVLLTSITKSAFHSEPRIICRDEIVDDDLTLWFTRHNPDGFKKVVKSLEYIFHGGSSEQDILFRRIKPQVSTGLFPPHRSESLMIDRIVDGSHLPVLKQGTCPDTFLKPAAGCDHPYLAIPEQLLLFLPDTMRQISFSWFF